MESFDKKNEFSWHNKDKAGVEPETSKHEDVPKGATVTKDVTKELTGGDDKVNSKEKKEEKKEEKQSLEIKDLIPYDIYNLSKRKLDVLQLSLTTNEMLYFIRDANNALADKDPNQNYLKIDGKDIILTEIPYNANSVGKAIRKEPKIDLDNFDVINREITSRINPINAASIPVVAIKRELLKTEVRHTISKAFNIKQYSEKIDAEKNKVLAMNSYIHEDNNIILFEKDEVFSVIYLSFSKIMSLIVAQAMKLPISDFNKEYIVKGLYVNGTITIRATKKNIRVAETASSKVNTIKKK